MIIDSEQDKSKLQLLSYDGRNGLTIYCKSCGYEMEETCNGYYDPIIYNNEQFNRYCDRCRED